MLAAICRPLPAAAFILYSCCLFLGQEANGMYHKGIKQQPKFWSLALTGTALSEVGDEY